MLDLQYEKDESLAIQRLEMEMSVNNNPRMKSNLTILNKIKEWNLNITKREKEQLIMFLWSIPIFKDAIPEIKAGGTEFKKIWEGLDFLCFEKGDLIYPK